MNNEHTGELPQVARALNLLFHGVRTGERPQLFAEVREWLREMDDAETKSLHSLICGAVHRHCKDIQLPFGINGLENDLVNALAARSWSGASASGISWSALLISLERLRSKNRNPDADWYNGWNAAIQCLINDINARASTPVTAPVSTGEQPPRCVKCGHDAGIERTLKRCKARIDGGEALCQCHCVFPAATSTTPDGDVKGEDQ